MLNERGFSLLDSLVALVVVGVLASLAYPSFAQALVRARRSDAIVRLLDVQQAQERWRANHPAYGTLEQLQVPPSSGDSAYRLSVPLADATGYVVQAEATGPQARDSACAVMRLSVQAGDLVFSSGPDDAVANGAAANRRCWQQ
jgi:type IV pilus assembly protein PilE